MAKLYAAYARRLRENGAMDFDDLIYHTVNMLTKDAEARQYYQQKFRYVMVDEYQDTSIAQFHLVRLLGGGYNNVCVVGATTSPSTASAAPPSRISSTSSSISRAQRPSAWSRTTALPPTS